MRYIPRLLQTRPDTTWLRDPYRWLSLLGLFVLVGLAIALRHDVGLTLDEMMHMRYGRKILCWFSSGFADRRALTFGGAVAHYGGLFDVTAQLAASFTPEHALATRHAASALWAVLGIVATWKIAERLGGPRAALLAACVLSTTPCWVGHGLFNPKDIPFAAAAAWVVYGMLRLASNVQPPSLALSIGCGVALGAALGVRPSGMFLLAYPALALFARPFIAQPPAAGWKNAALRLATCWTVAWLCMLSAWPWAQMSPFVRPFEGAWEISHSAWNGHVLFGGEFIEAQHLPRSYLPMWFAITLPESYLLALACGTVALGLALRAREVTRRQLLAVGCVAFALFGPLSAALVLRPAMYDAQRHFLFLVPPMAALAGYALSTFFARRELRLGWRAAVGGMLAGVFAVVASDMIRMHPYEYTYFNRISGSLPSAAARFETDYWGAAYYEAMVWLDKQLKRNDSSSVRLGTCNHPDVVDQYLKTHPELARHAQVELQPGEADIYLASTRGNCHKTPGQVVHVVERMGVPLLYVIQRRAIAVAPRQGPRVSRGGS